MTHTSVCVECGATSTVDHDIVITSSTESCICGYSRAHSHSYTYTPHATGRSHRATCVSCGYSKIEHCIGITYMGNTEIYCGYCGQSMTPSLPPLDPYGAPPQMTDEVEALAYGAMHTFNTPCHCC